MPHDKVSCRECGKGFPSRKERRAHTAESHAQSPASPAVLPSVDVSSTPTSSNNLPELEPPADATTGQHQISAVNLPSERPLRVVTRCRPCSLCIYKTGGLKKHKKTKEHIDTCIQQDLYCFDCEKTFAKPETKEAHFNNVHDPTNSLGPARYKVCIARESQVTAMQDPVAPPPASSVDLLSASAPERRVVNRCFLCDVCIYEKGGLKTHKRTKEHIEICTRQGLYCFECKKAYTRSEAKEKHDKQFHDPDNPAEFRCLACDKNFASNKLFKRHLRGHASRSPV